MELRPGYKRTEIGVIPDDWGVAFIEDHTTITTGSKNTQDRVEDGLYPFFVRSQDVERINSYSFDGAAVLTAGDGVGTGKVFHYINGRFDVHQRVYRMSDFRDGLNGIYFFLIFSTRFYDRIMSMTAKSSVDSVRREMIARMQIPLPPLPEQKAIAEALSDVDASIVALSRLIAKKRDLRQGAMQRLLTGQSRLPGFTAPWQEKRLGDLLRVRHGKSQKQVEAIDGRFPILATGGVIGWAREPLYDRPSVLIGRKGTIDQPQYMNTPFWSVDTLFYTEMLNASDSKFLFYRFLLIDWRQYNEASGVPSLNARTIENVEIACPEPNEQAAIARILSDMDAELAALNAHLEKTRALKQAMTQALLTGRVRLPVRRDAAPQTKVAAHA